ncbi:hypothetical protein B840_01025 [Corynebacterium marinum DSM 44953]|jgi:hypothetical protein|uniref:Uncharacterized protein n=1 Tax=Corynebacterium marinum DSM 44953 TaxID=1224162 RepID=A0A0B6TNP9_9CORY|nr:hypothetical protein B840_01025 [Corynebacterium marinum DSM 44953]
MLHGSAEIGTWLSSPFVFAWDFFTWPFRTLLAHF